MNWDKLDNLKILIIDDDPFTRELIRTMLQEVPSITIHQANDGLEALSMVKDNKYDLFLLDLYMPKLNGKEFIKSLKENKLLDKKSTIVLISTDRLTKKELQDIGANYYLTKPFDFCNFVQNIHDFLEKEMLFNES